MSRESLKIRYYLAMTGRTIRVVVWIGAAILIFGFFIPVLLGSLGIDIHFTGWHH
jgi:hypothetical protein